MAEIRRRCQVMISVAYPPKGTHQCKNRARYLISAVETEMIKDVGVCGTHIRQYRVYGYTVTEIDSPKES